MANEEHLKKLEEGVELWNKWRLECPDIKSDFQGANLAGARLEKANLARAQLQGANLQGASGFEILRGCFYIILLLFN